MIYIIILYLIYNFNSICEKVHPKCEKVHPKCEKVHLF